MFAKSCAVIAYKKLMCPIKFTTNIQDNNTSFIHVYFYCLIYTHHTKLERTQGKKKWHNKPHRMTAAKMRNK